MFFHRETFFKRAEVTWNQKFLCFCGIFKILHILCIGKFLKMCISRELIGWVIL